MQKVIDKLLSRKLLVLVAATVMAFTGVLPVADWQLLAMGYIGAQGMVDGLQGLKK